MTGPTFGADFFTLEGRVRPDMLCKALMVDEETLAGYVGLNCDMAAELCRSTSLDKQERLADLARWIARVSPWTGSPVEAFTWLRVRILPGFGCTGLDLIMQGRGADLQGYLDRIECGGYA
jgi:hypothetical protein